MNRFRTIAVTAVAGLVLVACSPAASGSGSESAGAEASQAESQAVQPSAGGNLPSFTEGAAADLEALIPDSAGGVTLTKTSMQGSEFLLSGGDDPTTVKFLQDLSVSPSDVSLAYGFGFSSDLSSGVAMFVFRAAGAESSHLVSVFKEATDAERDTPLAWTSTTFGGKQVQTAVDAESGGQTIYLYAKDDVLFFVGATDTAIAEEIVSGLP